MGRVSQEINSFRRPERAHVAAPSVGAHAPPTSLYVHQDLPVVIGFLRHCGCPFAEKTLLALRRLAERHREIRFIAVSHADEEATQSWLQEVGEPGMYGCNAIRCAMSTPHGELESAICPISSADQPSLQ